MDHTPKLEQLQKIVGGYIELVPYFTKWEGKSCVVFCNENGKLENLPLNKVATLMWYMSSDRQINDSLVGVIALVTGPQEMLEDM